jgi:hypothetical protein
LIRLKVEHLSKDREAPAGWLWSFRTGASEEDVDRVWKAFLRRFRPGTHLPSVLSRPSAGLGPDCANQKRPTAGPG